MTLKQMGGDRVGDGGDHVGDGGDQEERVVEMETKDNYDTCMKMPCQSHYFVC